MPHRHRFLPFQAIHQPEPEDLETLPRGVYVEQFTRRGYHWAVAIDSRGACVLECPILDVDDRQTVVNGLWRRLDALDAPRIVRSILGAVASLGPLPLI